MERIYTYLAAIVSSTLLCFKQLLSVSAQSPSANTILIILIGLSKFNMASRCVLRLTSPAADAGIKANKNALEAAS